MIKIEAVKNLNIKSIEDFRERFIKSFILTLDNIDYNITRTRDGTITIYDGCNELEILDNKEYLQYIILGILFKHPRYKDKTKNIMMKTIGFLYK